MTDIFISYAREDRERVQALVAALEHSGFSVWWDREIAAGRDFRAVIDQQLRAASLSSGPLTPTRRNGCAMRPMTAEGAAF